MASDRASSDPPAGYVAAGKWVDPPGRADHIDEVADAFERPTGAGDFWSGVQDGWPSSQRTRGFTERYLDRRAG